MTAGGFMIFPKKHLFICTNGGDKPGKCGSKDSEAFHANVKSMARELPNVHDIRVNKSGCLGQCEHGIAAVLYPEGVWKLNLKEGDEQSLLELLKKLNSI